MAIREDYVDISKKAPTEREVERTHVMYALREADSEEMVEQVFEKAGIGSLDERITMLKEVQGGKKVKHFYTPNFKYLTPEQKYTFELQVFLTGAWKKYRSTKISY